MTIETYADSGDYTYPPGAERLLVQSTNWPADVNAQLAQQRADNVRLEEVIAWLENELGVQRNEQDLLKIKVAAIGRKLARVVEIVEKRNHGLNG